MNQTSTSFAKRKKGLSVSLEKKKTLQDEPFSTISTFKSTIIRQSLDSANSSAKKNKIKFAQSYQKHQTGSKFKKQNYLKITDQDIKLGGNKKIDHCQRKILPFTVTAPFSEYNSRIQFQPRPLQNTIYGGQRKVLRESKAVNLASNINYFQGMNFQKENTFYLPSNLNISRQNLESNLRIGHEIPSSFKKLETLVENKLEESQLTTSPQKQLSPSLFTKLSPQIQKNEFQVASLASSKQSMDRATLQKLKKVQTDIDQLLAKASQTRAMLLR